MLELPVPTFKFLMDLAAQEPPLVTTGIAEAACGAAFARLTSQRLLVPGKHTNGILAGPEDHEIRQILPFGDGGDMLTFFHPDDGLISVSADSIRRWMLDTNRLADLLAHMLGMPASFRPTTLVDDILWDLGTPRVDKTLRPILFGRRLFDGETRIRIRHELECRRGGKPALLLVADRQIQTDLTLPAVSHVVPVQNVLVRGQGMAQIDPTRLLAGKLMSFNQERRPAIACADDGSWIRLLDVSFRFSGKIQKRIIRLIYESWERGESWCNITDILSKANSGCDKLKEAFNRNQNWHHVIEVQGNDCRIRAGNT